VRAAKQAGADAIKLQTYTPDTMTIDSDAPPFVVQGTPWHGRTLYDLYSDACTPWEWHEPLMAEARLLGLHCFSTPFDATAVDYLERLDVPAYKVASFELVDIPLLRRIGRTGKPVILSTGMATIPEIKHAADVLRANGARDVTLLHTVSAYPTPPEEANLAAMKTIADATGFACGWSDHTVSPGVILRAVGRWQAPMVEFHLDLDRTGAEYAAGHCWLPEEMAPVIAMVRDGERADGDGLKRACPSELPDRDWRADPSDGLRPLKHIRRTYRGEAA